MEWLIAVIGALAVFWLAAVSIHHFQNARSRRKEQPTEDAEGGTKENSGDSS
jgi:hypothetical protein